MTFDKGSLILLDYTARIKDNGEIFETTIEEDAKKSNLYDPTRKYEPRLISVGEGWVLKGLDEALTSTDVGQKLSIEISPDKGFGERDTNKVRMIPQRKLGEKANEIKVGDVVELDDRTGIVRYIGSGRVQIDYNHRLASRVLVYDVNVVKKIESNEDKIKYLLKRRLPLDDEKAKIEHNDDTVVIELSEDISLLDGLQIIKKAVTTDIFKFVDGLNKITFQEVYLSQKAKDSSPSPSSTTTTTTTTTNETVTSDTSPRSDTSLRSETASKSENKTE
ncbi:MAG: FKBP-type peptidyl-prolyl cis-trans isomerase [Nitrososphaeraceae archaeon]|jgi:peptidylprolyl isomerase|nr:FKBP-type peptidyl-prolyl cis-trans isomerase [Nitrososphaeraceae archaeon]